MSTTNTGPIRKQEKLAEQLAQVTAFLVQAFQQGQAVQAVERG